MSSVNFGVNSVLNLMKDYYGSASSFVGAKMVDFATSIEPYTNRIGEGLTSTGTFIGEKITDLSIAIEPTKDHIVKQTTHYATLIVQETSTLASAHPVLAVALTVIVVAAVVFGAARLYTSRNNAQKEARDAEQRTTLAQDRATATDQAKTAAEQRATTAEQATRAAEQRATTAEQEARVARGEAEAAMGISANLQKGFNRLKVKVADLEAELKASKASSVKPEAKQDKRQGSMPITDKNKRAIKKSFDNGLTLDSVCVLYSQYSKEQIAKLAPPAKK